MERMEFISARKEGREQKKLNPSDYLLGVDDQSRMGALRFKLDEKGEFLNDNKNTSTPPFASLEQLEEASMKFQENNYKSDQDKWVNKLIAYGSPVGGARPKASVIDEQNNLWIAKFPSRHDQIDVGAWEMVTNKLALLSGINVADGQLKKFNSQYKTYLSKRFDRKNKNQRIHFASAETLIGYATNDYVHSYLDLAQVLIQNGSNTNKDLEELWRRIIFNIYVNNNDDHLRNNGFLLTRTGWTLSPAYDMNPSRDDMGLYLNISETSNAADPKLALEQAKYFRLTDSKAKEIIAHVKKSVSYWRELADKYFIPKDEQDWMAVCFSRLNKQ